MKHTTQNSRDIKATQEDLYNAFINPAALEAWQVPDNMTAKVHNFNPGVGYEMSLFYPETEKEMKGKTTGKEDKYAARFVELVPNKKIVEAIKFDSPDPGFAEEMFMEISFDRTDTGTRVTILFKNIPDEIKPEDNEAGTISSLEKLAKFVEGKND